MHDPYNRLLIHQLGLAMTEEESLVDDFTVLLFIALGYFPGQHGHFLISSRRNLRLRICGEHRHAKPDVSILDASRNNIIILIQESKRQARTMPSQAPAQLVAEAIAAFNNNNSLREAAGVPPLAEEVGHFGSSLIF